ncbi:MAG: class I mannose-6-phosphate isomerase [Muribaculaceae bacterium]|nr:class I mannose-6-phosphate isomerase [Muribaculaceae bacterium]
MQPFKFIPQLKPVLWGGNRITQLKHLPDQGNPIGESWEISGMPGHESVVAQGEDASRTLNWLIQHYKERLVGHVAYERYAHHFPLLIKIIDARQPLSIQVHPSDELAARRHQCPGKTEMWYIVETAPQSLIMAGLNRTLTPMQFESLIRDNQLDQSITHYHSLPGDVYFLPAGTIHSIGAGNLLVEIQQASDITYRVYDYGRLDADGQPRPLHIEQARDAIHYAPQQGIASHCSPTDPGETLIASCPYFSTSHLAVDGHHRIQWTPMRSFLAMVGIEGDLDIVTDGSCHTPLSMGESILIPACTESIEAVGTGRLIMAQMPHNPNKNISL